MSHRSHAEGTWRTKPFLEKLDVDAERPGNERACHVDPAQYPMELQVTLPEAVRKLHRAEKESIRSGDSVRQEPLKGRVMLPRRMAHVHEKRLVMHEYVRENRANQREKQIFLSLRRRRCDRNNRPPKSSGEYTKLSIAPRREIFCRVVSNLCNCFDC